MKKILIGAFLILMSCNGQKKTIVKNTDNNPEAESSLVLLLQDEHIGFDVEETLVIKDEKRLKSFYSKINMTRKPGLPVPIIDFSKEMVVVRCNGEQNYSGVSELVFSEEKDTQVVLDARVQKDSREATRNLKTNLFCVYKMPLTDKEVIVNNAQE